MDNKTRIAELTVEELRALMRELLREELHGQPPSPPRRQSAILELEPLHVGGWPQDVTFLSRQDYYDDAAMISALVPLPDGTLSRGV
ncbi:MAG: hypothetical protein IPK19_18780 [Chloroflexi bacterium]|nr:hypothetical protein [Chloroflexota bacterium]